MVNWRVLINITDVILAVWRVLINITAVILAVMILKEGYTNDITIKHPIMFCYFLILLVPNVCSLLEQISSSKRILTLTVITFNISLLVLNLLCIGFWVELFFKCFGGFYRGFIPMDFYIILWVVFIINYIGFVLLIFKKFKEKCNRVSLIVAVLCGIFIAPIGGYEASFLCSISFLVLFMLTLKNSLPDGGRKNAELFFMRHKKRLIKYLFILIGVLCCLLLGMVIRYFAGADLIRERIVAENPVPVTEIILGQPGMKKIVISNTDVCRFFTERVTHKIKSCDSGNIEVHNVSFVWRDNKKWKCGTLVLHPLYFSIIPEVFYGDEEAESSCDLSSGDIPIVYDAIYWFLTYKPENQEKGENIEISNENYLTGKELISRLIAKDYNYLSNLDLGKATLWSETLALQMALARKDFTAARILLKQGVSVYEGQVIFFIDHETPEDIKRKIYKKFPVSGPQIYFWLSETPNLRKKIDFYIKRWIEMEKIL